MKVFEFVLGLIGALFMVAVCRVIANSGGSFEDSMLVMILIQVSIHNAKLK